MADRLHPLDEKTLRETKDDLMGRVTRHQKYEGSAQPDVRKAEEFVVPILRKVEVDHDRQRDQQLLPKADERDKPSRNKEYEDGEYYGQSGRRPEQRERSKVQARDGEKVTVHEQELGELTLKADGTVDASPELQALAAGPRYSAKEQSVIDCVRGMWQLPDWKDKLSRLYNSNLNDSDKQKGTHALIRKWIAMYKPVGKQMVL